MFGEQNGHSGEPCLTSKPWQLARWVRPRCVSTPCSRTDTELQSVEKGTGGQITLGWLRINKRRFLGTCRAINTERILLVQICIKYDLFTSSFFLSTLQNPLLLRLILNISRFSYIIVHLSVQIPVHIHHHHATHLGHLFRPPLHPLHRCSFPDSLKKQPQPGFDMACF